MIVPFSMQPVKMFIARPFMTLGVGSKTTVGNIIDNCITRDMRQCLVSVRFVHRAQ